MAAPGAGVHVLQLVAPQPGRERRVGVPEQAERPRGGAQGVHGVHLVEDVRVLVERRPVADLGEVGLTASGPAGRLRRYSRFGGVSIRAVAAALARATSLKTPGVVQAAGGAIVIAPDARRDGQRPQPLDDGVRFGAVADEIAEHQDAPVRRASRHRPARLSSASMLAWMSLRTR